MDFPELDWQDNNNGLFPQNTLIILRKYIDYMGSIQGGLFLTKLTQWANIKCGDQEGWMCITYADWKKHTYLAEYKVRKFTKFLKEKQILKTKITRNSEGNPALHYKLIIEEHRLENEQ